MTIQEIAQKMVASGKGILAADESNGSAGKRLAGIELENTSENRRRYRDLFLATDGIGEYLNGVILYDETLHQTALDGRKFADILIAQDVLVGIKVDLGLADFAGFDNEQITHGLDTLAERCAKYAEIGASFTKWRAVVRISDTTPTAQLIHTIACDLARYARIVQDAGMVPMLEPEVLLSGTHSLERAAEVTQAVLAELFTQCANYRVDNSAIILKTSMVVPGDTCETQASPTEVATATLEVLRKSVPSDVAGIVFLSGGQSAVTARTNLNAINQFAQNSDDTPWTLTFSFARAIQGPPLATWHGDDANLTQARTEFTQILQLNSQASVGEMQ